MRQNEIMFLEAYERIQELEQDSKEVREYLKNLQFLKMIDIRTLEKLKSIASADVVEEISKISNNVTKNKAFVWENSRSEHRSEQGFLIGKPQSIVQLYTTLKTKALNEMDLEIRPTKAYIAFVGRKTIANIVVQKSQIRIYLTNYIWEFEDDKNIVNDLSETVSFCNAPAEIVLRYMSEIDDVISVLKQAYILKS